jgi:hypothetical protein
VERRDIGMSVGYGMSASSYVDINENEIYPKLVQRSEKNPYLLNDCEKIKKRYVMMLDAKYRTDQKCENVFL